MSSACEVTAAIVFERDSSPKVQKVLLDAPAGDEVCVRMVGVGITDIDLQICESEGFCSRPAVLGHEGSGVVQTVGVNVTKYKSGDPVVIVPQSCTRCGPCKAGNPAYCSVFGPTASMADHRHKPAMTLAGGRMISRLCGLGLLASHALVPESALLKVPDTAPLALLGPIGNSFQTGAGTVLDVIDLQKGEMIGVFGCRAIGLSAIIAARICGCSEIVAIDSDQKSLALARQLGATLTIQAGSPLLHEEIRRHLGRGLDHGLDTTTDGAMMQHAAAAVDVGGTVTHAISRMHGPLSQIHPNPSFFGKTIRLIIRGHIDPADAVPVLTDLFLEGHLPFTEIVKFYGFTEINAAMAALRERRVAKPIIRLAPDITLPTSLDTSKNRNGRLT